MKFYIALFIVILTAPCPTEAQTYAATEARQLMERPLDGQEIYATCLMKKAVEALAHETGLCTGIEFRYRFWKVRSLVYNHLFGHGLRGQKVMYIAETQEWGSWGYNQGLDDSRLLEKIRKWRKVMMTYARDYLNDPRNLWMVYRLAKPIILKEFQDPEIRELLQEKIDEVYTIIMGTHPKTNHLVVSRAYKHGPDQCFYAMPLGVSQEETCLSYCLKLDRMVFDQDLEEGAVDTGELYDFFLRREDQGGPELIQAYEEILFDLAQSLGNLP